MNLDDIDDDNGDAWKKHEMLGEGTFGVVVRAERRGEWAALKEYKHPEDLWSSGIPDTCIREVACLKRLCGSGHIVRLLDVRYPTQRTTFQLVLELCDTTLQKLVRQQPPAKRRDGAIVLAVVARQLATGLAYMHARGIVHRDLKPCNVLVDVKRGNLKFADFGLARHVFGQGGGRCYTYNVVTTWYRPPELLRDEACAYDPRKVDVWSLGMTVAQTVLGGYPLVHGENNEQMREAVTNVFGDDDSHDGPPIGLVHRLPAGYAGIAWLSQLLLLDPDRRATAETALMHPYTALAGAATTSLREWCECFRK